MKGGAMISNVFTRGRADKPLILPLALVCVVSLLAGGALACSEDVKGSRELGGVEKTDQFVAGEIIVWFDEALSADEIDAAVAAAGGEITGRSDVTPSRVVIAVPEGEEDAYVEVYGELESVKAADKNYILKVTPIEGGTPSGGAKNKIGGTN
jgi:hypothetical protein